MELQSETILDLKGVQPPVRGVPTTVYPFRGHLCLRCSHGRGYRHGELYGRLGKTRHAFRLRLPSLRAHDRQEQMPDHLRSQGVRLRAAEDIHSHGARMLRTRISTLEACNPEELFSEEARRLVNETLDRLPERPARSLSAAASMPKAIRRSPPKWALRSRASEFEVSKAMKILRVVLKDYLAYFIFWFYIN